MDADIRLDETTRPRPEEPKRAAVRGLVLSIVFHPDVRRIGERSHLDVPGDGRICEVSRLRPEFRTVDGRHSGPLQDPYLSRAPLLLLPDGGGGVLVRRPASGPPPRIGGQAISAARSLSPAELDEGVVIELAGRVVLLLHAAEELADNPPKYGLVGESVALQHVRREILDVAGLALPVLLRGESGTGKELVARAIHAASPRAARPCVCVNLAALNPQTAVAELFGHARGAFTGAVRARDGYFREADGGTLFLDEIGEAPVEVQVMLLRALETGEIQPVGGGATRHVDVRLIAATDANLEEAVLRGAFRVSLLHRLAGYEVWLPPLRRRRDDIARLLVHFIRSERARWLSADSRGRGEGDGDLPLSAELVARLVRYDWPGNVRQLNNVARQLVALHLAGREFTSSAPLARVLAAVPDEAPAQPSAQPVSVAARSSARSARPAGQISDAALIAALQHNRWAIDATARHLGISKTSLYGLIDRCPQIHKARDLSREVLLAAYERCEGDLTRMSQELRVSMRGLQLRLRELGVTR